MLELKQLASPGQDHQRQRNQTAVRWFRLGEGAGEGRMGEGGGGCNRQSGPQRTLSGVFPLHGNTNWAVDRWAAASVARLALNFRLLTTRNRPRKPGSSQRTEVTEFNDTNGSMDSSSWSFWSWPKAGEHGWGLERSFAGIDRYSKTDLQYCRHLRQGSWVNTCLPFPLCVDWWGKHPNPFQHPSKA